MVELNHLEDLPNYISEPNEEYMNDKQLAHFRSKLIAWKNMIMEEIDQTVKNMQSGSETFTDSVDRASHEENWGVELKTRSRESKLIKKIDDAVKRIDQKTYGYCLVSGEPIGLERLDARPTSEYSIETKQMLEKQENNFRSPYE